MISLTQQDLVDGWCRFRGYLYKRGFPPGFIEDTGRDLFAEAQLDVTRLIEEGRDVYWPCGLLAHCAWRRTQHLVRKRANSPRSVSIEVVGELADKQFSPEAEALSDDLTHCVRDAVVFLLPPEREIIELIYFSEMTCLDAGRFLGWSSSKSQRIHQSALERLRPLLEQQGLGPVLKKESRPGESFNARPL